MRATRERRGRQCPRCGRWWPRTVQRCGFDQAPLKPAPFRMTRERVKYVHVLAMARKGLTDEEYRLRLGAVGVSTCKDLKREGYLALVRGLRRLPDSPRWKARASARRVA